MALNIYKSDEFIDAYSKGGTYVDPIFPSPDIKFDGVNGQTRDIKLFLRNDGVFPITNVEVEIQDSISPSEADWTYLAATLVGLDIATAGQALSLPGLAANEDQTFWLRIVVPAATAFQKKQDLSLRLTAK